MKLKLLVCVLAGVAALSGCQSMPTASNVAETSEVAATAPVCHSAQRCTDMWGAAQLWLVHNSDYKLQTVTNVVISTYNAGATSASLAFTVTKEPIAQGVYKIAVDATCNNLFGCVPSALDAELAFNKAVSATP